MNNYDNSLQYIKNAVTQLYTTINYLINPPMCVACKTLDIVIDNALLCSVCDQKIVPVVSTSLVLSSKYTLTIFAISAYQEPLKSLILAKMYSDIAVSAQLGKLIWDKTYIKHMQPDMFVPIPLHWRRYAQRGYNQAQEMANVLACQSKKPTVGLLQRRKSTVFQFGLSSVLRKENVADAFVMVSGIDSTLYYDKHIVLVDDLLTTGATLKEAAQQLMILKPKTISAVVACRVI